jgi:hypothetical protein
MARMTRHRLQRFLRTADAETVRREYLDHCWIPVAMFRAWCRRHHLPDSAPRFESPDPLNDRGHAEKLETTHRTASNARSSTYRRARPAIERITLAAKDL